MYSQNLKILNELEYRLIYLAYLNELHNPIIIVSTEKRILFQMLIKFDENKNFSSFDITYRILEIIDITCYMQWCRTRFISGINLRTALQKKFHNLIIRKYSLKHLKIICSIMDPKYIMKKNYPKKLTWTSSPVK